MTSPKTSVHVPPHGHYVYSQNTFFRNVEIELRRPWGSTGTSNLSSDVTCSSEVLVAATAGSSEYDARGLPELPLLLSKEPNMPFLPAVGLPGDPIGGEVLLSENPP